ncbi:hypothetical protein GC089_12295 [Cellulomonas sp. JZ18]|nr:hypothetical protein GC089_12295 [Cellulomonas sp. JZ18]
MRVDLDVHRVLQQRQAARHRLDVRSRVQQVPQARQVLRRTPGAARPLTARPRPCAARRAPRADARPWRPPPGAGAPSGRRGPRTRPPAPLART